MDFHERLQTALSEPVEPMDLEAPAKTLVLVPWTTPTANENAFARTLELADMRDTAFTVTRQEPVTVTYTTTADAVEAFLGSLSDDERQALRTAAEKVARASNADADDVFDALVRALASRVYSGMPIGDGKESA